MGKNVHVCIENRLIGLLYTPETCILPI